MSGGITAIIVLLVIIAIAAIAGGLYWYFKKRNENGATLNEYSEAIATSSLHDELAANGSSIEMQLSTFSYDSTIPTASQYSQPMPANLDTSLAVGASQFPSVTAKMTSTFEMGE